MDDSITQALNALNTPARTGFDPQLTSWRQPGPVSHRLDSGPCRDFKSKVLFPAWQVRSDVLSYCAMVATSPDPDDPTVTVREMEMIKNRDKVVDERLDPYSGRFFPTEPRTEQLALIIRQERAVEDIIRTQSWKKVIERCGGQMYDWKEAMGEWRNQVTATAVSSRGH